VSTFNSLSYATRLVDAGVPRDQAEVHALVLQSVYEEEHKQYATKTDFLELRQEVKQQILHLEAKTDRIAAKTDQLEIKTDRIEAKITEVEVKLSAEISSLAKTVNECKEEFLSFRADVSVLRTSHKYIVWISGGVATMCLSVIALCIPIFLHTLK
jgi:predicted RNase H-like nuclease (RuvC/YqgF family)